MLPALTEKISTVWNPTEAGKGLFMSTESGVLCTCRRQHILALPHFFHFEARNLGIFGTLNEVIPLTESGFADSFANLMLDDGKGAELHFAQKWAQN